MLDWRPLCAALLSLGLQACRTSALAPPPDEVRAVEHTLDALYGSFCFDAGGEADWEALRSLVVDGAAFVAPIGAGEAPRAVGTDEFIADFQAWIATEAGAAGLHERIVSTRVDLFGHVAHAFVTFEGFVPPDGAATTRGVDSIQLVRDGERWLVASFTTQYASEAAPIPARFEP